MKTTRRDFIKHGIAGAAFASAAANGSIVNSIVGAKNSSYSIANVSFDNPYITDGLIAMWDGEWNTRNGSHSTSIASWPDLMSNAVVEFQLGPKGDAETAAVDALDNGVYISEMCGQFTHAGVQNAMNNRTFTIEYVVNPDIGRDSCRYYVLGDSWRNGNGSWYWGLCGVRTTSPWAKVPVLGEANYLSIAEDIGERRCRIINTTKGVMKYSDSVQDTQDFYASSQFVLCGSPSQWAYNFSWNGIIHSVRIYSRALTEEEIDYNYSVDKERFQLP